MKVFCFRQVRISEEQIRNELKEIEEGTMASQDSDVYEIWMSFAEDWFSEPDQMYETLRFGFRGFLERPVETILLDFAYNCDEIKED